jgi:hypothetical protein
MRAEHERLHVGLIPLCLDISNINLLFKGQNEPFRMHVVTTLITVLLKFLCNFHPSCNKKTITTSLMPITSI